MKKIISLLTFIAITISVFAQVNFSVKGKIMDASGYLPAGNIMALNPQDSSLIKGTFFLDGAFELPDLQQEKILIQLSSLEFADIYLPVQYEGQNIIDLGAITANQAGTALAEVVVKGKRAVYTQKGDGTIAVLIQNTTLAASNSVTEILSKSPDVLTDDEGSIEVFGKGNAIIYLNGKRITNNELNMIAPANIHKIEIIRNPSAKYDADGAAVIHIQTIRGASDGYQVNLMQNASYGDFWGADAYSSLNANFKKNRFSSNAQYSFRKGDNRHVKNTTRDRSPEDGFFSSDVSIDWQNELEGFSQYGLGVQYDLSDNGYLSLGYSGASENLGGQTISTNTLMDDRETIFYESTIDKDEKAIDNSVSLNYQQALGTDGSQLFIGGQYASFQTNTDNKITEKSTIEENSTLRNLKSIYDLNVKIITGQIDYTKVFKNENQLSIGSKFSSIQNISGLDFLVANEENIFSKNPKLSNNFTYREDVTAGYISFEGKTDQFNYTAGLRVEHTDYGLDLLQEDQQTIADKYLHCFPNLSINKQFSADLNWNFAYTSSIARPPYERLNPAPIYQDPYTSIQGNPFLKPARTHALELSSQFKKTTFKIGYNNTQDILGGAAIRGETDRSYILIRVNHDVEHAFFSSISNTFSNDWWTSTNTASLYYTKIINRELVFEGQQSRPQVYFFSNNQFKIKNIVNLEALFWYIGTKYEGIFKRAKSYNLALTLNKTFFDNSLKVNLIANDILRSVRADGEYFVGNTAITFDNQWSSDYFRVSIAYNFGQLKKAGYKNKSIGASESNRAN